MEEKLTLIDFIAQLINNQKAREEGYDAAPRWLCTREDIRKECLEEANKVFEKWKKEELEAKENRNNLLK